MQPIRLSCLPSLIAIALFLGLPFSPEAAIADTICDGDCRAEMLAMAYIADLSGSIENVSDETATSITNQRIDCLLAKNPDGLSAGWKIVWGPFVTMRSSRKFPEKKDSANAMFVAQYKETSTYVVAIAGTNSESRFEWMNEDFSHSLEPWPYGGRGICQSRGPQRTENVCVTGGTLLGLKILQSLNDSNQTQNIREFLKSVAQKASLTKKRTTIYVTGHSLGGALAPALALWLSDTRGNWDPKKSTTLQVFAFAGPTPGNQGFAEYVNTRFPGDASHSEPVEDGMKIVNNTLDVVPHAFDNLDKISNLYKEVRIKPGLELRLLIDALVQGSAHHGFTTLGIPDQVHGIEGVLKNSDQLAKSECPEMKTWAHSAKPHVESREVSKSRSDYKREAAYQHVCAYPRGLGISNDFLVQMNSCVCKNHPSEVMKAKCNELKFSD